MVVRMAGLGRSFRGVTDYCLHDRRLEGEPHPESSKRVKWTETRNLATSQGERAARIMAATAEAGGELKRLAGVAATGRKLEKPVAHYSLSWAEGETPDRGEMRRAVEGSLQALGMEGHQALIVAHNDGQPHVHVIVNRVDPESGKAAGLSRSKLDLSRWAEGYEREQGQIRCRQREINNERRSVGERVVDGRGHSGGRWRRERMSPHREQRVMIPAGRGGEEMDWVAWHRAEERSHWQGYQRQRGKALGELEKRSKGEWSELYGRQGKQRERMRQDCRGVLGRFRAWRELGGGVREIGGAIRGSGEVLGRFRKELDDRQRQGRVSLGKAHAEAVRDIERQAGAVYRRDMEGSAERALSASRTDGRSVFPNYERGVDWYTLRRWVQEEQMEQVREVKGEKAYERMKQGFERASQPPSSTPVRPSLTDQMKTYRQSIPPDHVELEAKPTTNLPGGPIAYQFEDHPMPQDLKGLATKDFGYNQVIAHAPLTEVQNHFRTLPEAERPTFDTEPSR